MIISASYKTDIPAFYAEWFMSRLRAGYCKVVNPYNHRQVTVVSLKREDVGGFVFWTRNVEPFLEVLDYLKSEGFPFVVQHSITGYPPELEHAVIPVEASVAHLREVRERYGPKVAIWRYDPIVVTSLTPVEFHRIRFGELAQVLEGTTDEVVVSFAKIYDKTRRNISSAAFRAGFHWWEPDPDAKKALLEYFLPIAEGCGMRVSICAQPENAIPGTHQAHCIDAARLTAVAGRLIVANIKGNRPGCMCHEAKDIGDYDTCPHGCVYCYANTNKRLASRRHEEHDPKSEFLYPIRESKTLKSNAPTEMDLFEEV